MNLSLIDQLKQAKAQSQAPSKPKATPKPKPKATPKPKAKETQNPFIQNFKDYHKQLEQSYLVGDQVKQVWSFLLCCTIAEQNAVLVSPHGEAKSGIEIFFSKLFKGASLGKVQFNDATEIDQLFGSFDFDLIEDEGAFSRKTENGILSKNVVILDEIDKTPRSVQNYMLSFLAEREYNDLEQVVKYDPICVLATSNEDLDHSPFSDRFCALYMKRTSVTDFHSSYTEMYKKKKRGVVLKEPSKYLHFEYIQHLKTLKDKLIDDILTDGSHSNIEWNDMVNKILTDSQSGQETDVSPRTYLQALELIATWSVLHHEEELELKPLDAFCLKYVFAFRDDYDEIEKRVRRYCGSHITNGKDKKLQPYGYPMYSSEQSLEDAKAKSSQIIERMKRR